MNSQPVVPVQMPGAVGNTYHPPGGPLTQEQIAWCRNRPADVPRRALPAAGDVVGLRRVPAGPVVAARVLEVLDMAGPWAHEHDQFEPHGPDPNVWRVALNDARQPQYDPDRPGSYRFELTDDPWPSIVVCIDPVDGKGARVYTVVREERLAGLGGWLSAEEIGG